MALRSGIALSLGSDLTDHYVAGHHVCSDADDTALVEVLGGILAYVRDVGCELLHASLGLAHVERVFIDMHRGEYIVADHALVEHNRVLVVVTLPWHERHLEVASESEFALLRGVTLGEDIALAYALTLVADGTKVYRGSLVGAAELRKPVFLDS